NLRCGHRPLVRVLRMTAHLDYLGFSAQRCPAQGGLSHRCRGTENTENEKYSLHCTTSKVAGVAWIRGDAPGIPSYFLPRKSARAIPKSVPGNGGLQAKYGKHGNYLHISALRKWNSCDRRISYESAVQ